MPSRVATALLLGLDVDTALMTRGVEHGDLEAYSFLYVRADMQFINTNLRNSIQVKDFDFYIKALTRVRRDDNIMFCYFDDGCNQNLMGIIGDFFLTAVEIDLVCLAARNGNVINFSMRSEKKEWNAAFVIQRLLEGIGFGGGHADMAGGIIKDVELFYEDDFFIKLISLLRS
jgi:nanoRNase/pAp phosphatase (c-di-AMP/oligoRNAs hydrolase)